jgi:hypothetical protein
MLSITTATSRACVQLLLQGRGRIECQGLFVDEVWYLVIPTFRFGRVW